MKARKPTDTKCRKLSMKIKIGWLIAAVAASAILGGCASWARGIKTFSSDLGGGLDRTVRLYDYNGQQIHEWSGKFDVSSDNQEIFFDDENGKRVIIQGGIVVVEEN